MEHDQHDRPSHFDPGAALSRSTGTSSMNPPLHYKTTGWRQIGGRRLDGRAQLRRDRCGKIRAARASLAATWRRAPSSPFDDGANWQKPPASISPPSPLHDLVVKNENDLVVATTGALLDSSNASRASARSVPIPQKRTRSS